MSHEVRGAFSLWEIIVGKNPAVCSSPQYLPKPDLEPAMCMGAVGLSLIGQDAWAIEEGAGLSFILSLMDTESWCQFIKISNCITSGYCRQSVVGDFDDLLFWHTGERIHSGTWHYEWILLVRSDTNQRNGHLVTCCCVKMAKSLCTRVCMLATVVSKWQVIKLQLMMVWCGRKWHNWRS